MPFTIEERQSLLALKGVGTAVLSRLESLGYGSFAQLRQASALDIVAKASALTGSSCWKNSPQARAAIQASIDAARQCPVQESEAIR
ncbi:MULTISPECIES: helix-hairpin-helix domain-containing protein [Comamonas]|uniref:helix-hairpin-helix domain-containing protein n=1 Tax=Comamonas TaxID=283 RepID=UPI002112A310|nr:MULTISPECIES: helix-hairpin-helix domain-containing protein [Comamonas]UUC92100.1 helix-hairpin-helix domain-containing protein [Comamonas sp. C11]WEE76131.1 helix-hairpin-helix domain-containing protein [Comamonas testosteroni]